MPPSWEPQSHAACFLIDDASNRLSWNHGGNCWDINTPHACIDILDPFHSRPLSRHMFNRFSLTVWHGFVSFQSSLIDLKEHASSLASSGLKKDSKLKSLEIAIEQKKEECSKLETQLQKVCSGWNKASFLAVFRALQWLLSVNTQRCFTLCKWTGRGVLSRVKPWWVSQGS